MLLEMTHRIPKSKRVLQTYVDLSLLVELRKVAARREWTISKLLAVAAREMVRREKRKAA
jgi:hypothetical protein